MVLQRQTSGHRTLLGSGGATPKPVTIGYIWVFPRIGVPRNGWFIMENLLKWMIWGYPYFWKPPYDVVHLYEEKPINPTSLI